MSAMTHTGQCLCGKVTYAIDAEPLAARLCWCRDCQYIANGSATANVLFPAEAVAFSGEITLLEKTADSGNTVERGFCPTCGTQLFSRTARTQMPIRIRAGTLDDRELMAPQAIIWAGSAPSWAVLDPNLPQHGKGLDSAVIETYS
jgi:hypothetical protein